ncbi:MAG TPA: TadE/TadG family type IV pilus assembly protein [Candidatus Limnocylindrales bacterium]
MSRRPRSTPHPGRPERGQTLVEFALVIPIVFMIFSGIFDLGRAVYAYNTIANAARQGARVAAVNQLAPPDTNTQCAKDMPIEDPSNPHWSTRACAAAAAIGLGVPTSAVTVSYAPPAGTTLSCSPLHVGCLASVTVAYTWSANTPVIGRIVGPLTLTSTSQIPIERVFP